MLAEAERLDRLVSDLLDLSRAGAADLRLDLRPVDLVALAGQAGTVWADRCAARRRAIPPRGTAGSGGPVTDPLRVRQIVDNLAENALRVTPEGARRGSRRDAGHGVVPEAVIQVRDGGPGLTRRRCRGGVRAGRALRAVPRGPQVGTGVGLALVGRLADRLGGRAEAGPCPRGRRLLQRAAARWPRYPSGDPRAPLPAARPRLGPGCRSPAATCPAPRARRRRRHWPIRPPARLPLLPSATPRRGASRSARAPTGGTPGSGRRIADARVGAHGAPNVPTLAP